MAEVVLPCEALADPAGDALCGEQATERWEVAGVVHNVCTAHGDGLREVKAPEPCPSVKFGYVCQRGLGHLPAVVHAQLVRVLDDGKLRVAEWVDDKAGVRVTKLDPDDARRTIERLQAKEVVNAD